MSVLARAPNRRAVGVCIGYGKGVRTHSQQRRVRLHNPVLVAAPVEKNHILNFSCSYGYNFQFLNIIWLWLWLLRFGLGADLNPTGIGLGQGPGFD